MIKTQQVQQAMHQQMAQMVIKRFLGLCGLAGDHAKRDGDIAKLGGRVMCGGRGKMGHIPGPVGRAILGWP